MKWFGLPLLFVLAFGDFCSYSQAAPNARPTRHPSFPNVPRPAPDFAWSSITGKVRRLRDLRGQPVVLIFATNPQQKTFIKQVKEITREYRQLAAQNALFFVAFTKETGLISRSDVPFVILPDPITTADEYRVGDFGIAVIASDGNLDYATDRLVKGQRILDVIVNSYQRQVANRRQ
jgi:hypothetical protein